MNVDQLRPSGKLVARGTIWSVGGQLSSVLIQILTISILGRLLDPGDFGTVAMVTAIIGIGEIFRDFGLSSAAVQAPTLSHGERSNLFWLNTVAGGALGLLFLVSAELIASFYDQAGLGTITRVLSITFLLNGITTQPQANLIRDLRLKAVAASETISAVGALVVGVSMAVLGFGFWAIVGMQISRAATRMILSFAFSKFVPGGPQRDVSVRPFVRFGMGLFGAQILNYTSKNVDSVLIGRTLGAVTLGFYSRAYQLAYMPVSQLSAPLSRVALPTLSKLNGEDKMYFDFISRAQSILVMVAAAGYTVAVVYADILIRIALGPGWDASTPIFRILCAAAVFEAAHQVTYWLFVSKANTSRHFQFALLTRPVLVLAIVVAVPYGGSAVAIAFLVWIAVAWPIGLYWASKGTQVVAFELFSRAVRIIFSAVLIGAVAMISRSLLEDRGLIIEVSASGVAMVVTAVLVIAISPSIRNDLRNVLGAIRLLRPTK